MLRGVPICSSMSLYVSLCLSVSLDVSLCLCVSFHISLRLSVSLCLSFRSLCFLLFRCPLSLSRAPFPVLLLPLPFSASSVFSLSHLRPSWFSHVHLPDVFIFCLIFDPGTDEFNDIFFLSVYVSVFCAFKKFFFCPPIFLRLRYIKYSWWKVSLWNMFSRKMESRIWNIYFWKKKKRSFRRKEIRAL